MAALLDGAIGSTTAAALTLLKATPLVWTALGVAVAFRAGAFNIGAEGQFYIGALAAAAVGLGLGEGPAPVVPAFLASLAAGGAWALFAAFLRVRWGVSEVLGTIMMNFVALELVSWAVHGPLQEAAGAYPQSDRLAAAARLGRLWEGTRLHWGVVLALLAAAAVGLFLERTRPGFRLRALGAGPEAARAAGIDPGSHLLLAMGLSGALAGAGGASEILGVTHRLFERFSAGYGYTAIAVALLGGLRPGGIVLAALFFGALEAGSGTMQRVAGVPSVLVTLVQGVLLVAIVARAGPGRGGSRGDAPKDDVPRDEGCGDDRPRTEGRGSRVLGGHAEEGTDPREPGAGGGGAGVRP